MKLCMHLIAESVLTNVFTSIKSIGLLCEKYVYLIDFRRPKYINIHYNLAKSLARQSGPLRDSVEKYTCIIALNVSFCVK